MTRLIIPIATFAALAHFVAGITFTSPSAGAKLVAGNSINVKWQDGGDGPQIADLTTFQLFLCAGGNDAGQNQVLRPITTSGSFAQGNAASGMIDSGAGDNSPSNAYFLKMIAVGANGGTLTVYSSRFSYSGMTGSFPSAIQPYLSSISGTDGPPTEDQTTAAAGTNQAAGAFGVAYTMQTGLTRYAPMQPIPPTKITAKNTKPLFPTSSVSTATTKLPIPSIQTTVTQPGTFQVSSRTNTAAPAPHPSDDMQKFLNRWKD